METMWNLRMEAGMIFIKASWWCSMKIYPAESVWKVKVFCMEKIWFMYGTSIKYPYCDVIVKKIHPFSTRIHWAKFLLSIKISYGKPSKAQGYPTEFMRNILLMDSRWGYLLQIPYWIHISNGTFPCIVHTVSMGYS